MPVGDNRITVLQLFKTYKGNFPLHNEMIRLDQGRFRTVVCYLGGNPDGKNEIERLASRTEYFGCDSEQMRWYNITLLRRLKSLIESEHVHIVNCQLHRTTPLGVVASWLSVNRPIVLSSVHGMTTRSSFSRRLQGRLWRMGLHRYVTVSEAVAQSLLASSPGLAPDKVVTIHNGLDLTLFIPPADGEKEQLRRELFPDVEGGFWFGTAGRLSAVKNHVTLLRAFQKVLDRQPHCCLLIAGRGEMEEELKVLTSSLQIQDRVHFLGFRSDLPQIFKLLDGFVFPSLREGMPLALIEAMAASLPVLASRVGGIPEAVGVDACNSLVPVGDVEALAAAMLELAQMPATRRLVAGAGMRRQALEHFQAERMSRNYESLYDACYRAWLNRKS